uniref:Uncharacterized protein n=1 Tax=Salix viminalis TaxID=40686 RepID=A0A6N2MI51_SALVM
MNHQLNLFFPKIVAFFFNQSRPKTRRSLSRSLSKHPIKTELERLSLYQDKLQQFVDISKGISNTWIETRY